MPPNLCDRTPACMIQSGIRSIKLDPRRHSYTSTAVASELSLAFHYQFRNTCCMVQRICSFIHMAQYSDHTVYFSLNDDDEMRGNICRRATFAPMNLRGNCGDDMIPMALEQWTIPKLGRHITELECTLG
jgi:hypothetical protein